MVWYDCVGEGVLRDDGLGSSSHPLHEQERDPAEVHSCGHRTCVSGGHWVCDILYHQIGYEGVLGALLATVIVMHAQFCSSKVSSSNKMYMPLFGVPWIFQQVDY